MPDPYTEQDLSRVAEYARLALHAYDAVNDPLVVKLADYGLEPVSEAGMCSLYNTHADTPAGFKAASCVNGQGNFVLAYVGTEASKLDVRDVLADVLLGLEVPARQIRQVAALSDCSQYILMASSASIGALTDARGRYETTVAIFLRMPVGRIVGRLRHQSG